MSIVELHSKEELYFILTHYPKVILLFYVVWRVECARYNYAFIQESRKRNNIGIIFVRINCDIFPDIQILYDVNILKTPVTLFIKDELINKKLIGEKSVTLTNYCIDFSGL